MIVNFKGTYSISGDNILSKPVTDISMFLMSSKNCRKDMGKSYLDKDTFEYYVDVKEEKEPFFEKIAKIYKIDVKKKSLSGDLVSVAGNCAAAECEFDSILDKVIDLYAKSKNQG